FAEVSSSGAVNPLATIASFTCTAPCSISGTGGVPSGFATLTASLSAIPPISEEAGWEAFGAAARGAIAERSKVAAAQMYAKRFTGLRDMDCVGAGLLFSCVRFIL